MIVRLDKEQQAAARRQLLSDIVWIVSNDTLRKWQHEGKTSLAPVEVFMTAQCFCDVISGLSDIDEGIDYELDDLEDEAEVENDAMFIAVLSALQMTALSKRHVGTDFKRAITHIFERYGDHELFFPLVGQWARKEEKRWMEGKKTNLLDYELKEIRLEGGGMEKVKEFEKETGVQLFPGHYDKLDEVQRKRREVLKNRYLSLNDIIQNMHLTNQQKLMMYAMNGEYHNTYIERLINFAGHHCLNAEFVIYMLENPDVCTTYENTVDFLNEYANPSEARMKLDLARELIEGKWYIMGKYKGRETKFQLVPIDEINELRQKVGLPISKFTYDKKAPEEPKIPKEEEPMHTPEFVEHATEGGSNVIFEDDGFENAADHIEEAHEYDDA